MRAGRTRRAGAAAAVCVLVTAVLVALVVLLPPRGSASEARPRAVRVMPLGDSITWGKGSPSHSAYRAELWRLVAGQSLYTVRFVGSQLSGTLPEPQNEGHSGYTVDRIRAGVDRWTAAAAPDVVLLHIGINDLHRHVDPAHAPDRLAALVDRIYADRPGVSVVLLGLIPTTPHLQAQAVAYNRRAAALQGIERHRGRAFWYVEPPRLSRAQMADSLHPNDAGYARIARAFFPALSSAVAARATASAPVTLP
ncbi:SGNH/GDSL hydrolase family protein [Streptomyces sp. V4-01]|uniref:SGNH/GDSL hydrolase family protein n=1 Tax=Actinacidiphila polyblastidii TaxID=3110430 RepID=A0ABU7PGN9_9ACTN|nr:SGNH/GDSL hydrolase family protein [Streptomyces sp. V4-01]